MWNRLLWVSLTVSNSFKSVSSQHSAQSIFRHSMAFSYCTQNIWIQLWPLESGNCWVYLCIPHYLQWPFTGNTFLFHSKGTRDPKSRELTSGSGSKPCWYNTGQLFNLVTLLIQQMSLSFETHIWNHSSLTRLPHLLGKNFHTNICLPCANGRSTS